MSASLIETLQGLVTPALMQSVRAALGEPESAVRAGFGAAISRILAALLNDAGDRDLVGTVASLVGDIAREPSAISNVAGLLTGGVPSSTAALAGNKLLGTLFGSRLGGVTQAVAAASGLKPQSASALLSVAGPLVLSALGSKLGGGSVSGPALAGLLTQEASALGAGFMPALSGAAQTAKPFAATSASPARAAPASPPAARPQPAAASNDGLFRSFLWLLLPLAFIGWLFWQKISAPVEAPAPAPAAAPESAAPAPAEEKKAEAAPAAAIAPVPEPAPAPAPAPVPATALTPGPNGLIQQTLTGGEVIEIAPGGVESKVIAFLEDPTSVVDNNVWFDFDRLSFETRSSTLVADSMAQVKAIAAILNAYISAKVKIGGYTDNVGNPESNLKLSDDRAKQVMSELIALGIAADRIEAEGYGEQHAIAPNDRAEGRAQNRRIAISVRAK